MMQGLVSSSGKGPAVVTLFLALSVICGASGAHGAFEVGRDSFSISNGPGYCFAMAAFSRWHYLNYQGMPGLRDILNKQDQEKIARELQMFYSENLIRIQAEYCNKHHKDPRESFQKFIVGLAEGEPRIVLLMNKGRKGPILHAVLAYEWIADGNFLKVYDPNYPNETRVMQLDNKQYTSLDITYHEICFPEVLNDHQELVRKIESLWQRYAYSGVASSQSATRNRWSRR